jgi:hypothetical protein
MNAPTLKMVATTFAPLNEVGEIDPKLAWLARAAARFELVQAGAMDIAEAFRGLFAGLSCACERETIERWERLDRLRPKRRRK